MIIVLYCVIHWFGRGCLLNAGAKSDSVSIIHVLYVEANVAVSLIWFFYAVTVVAVT